MHVRRWEAQGRSGRARAVVRVAVVALLAFAPALPGCMVRAQGGPGGGSSGGGGASDRGGHGSGDGGGGSGGAEIGRPGDGGTGSEPGQGAGPGKGPGEPSLPGPLSVLVAQVRFAADGVVVVDGGTVTSASAWAPYLAPGMWVRAEGTWEGDAFQARFLDVTLPTAFSYYRGPASMLGGGPGWTEAWFSAGVPGTPGAGIGRLLARRQAAAGTEAQWLGRWSNGGWAGASGGLAPPPPPSDGWWAVQGAPEPAGPYGAGAIRWGEATPFPPP